MKTQLLIVLSAILLLSCKKDKEEEYFDTYAYEVDCQGCDIEYVNENNEAIVVKNHSGRFYIDFNLNKTINLEVSVTIKQGNDQSMIAAIYMNEEVVKSSISFTSFTVSHQVYHRPRSNRESPSTSPSPKQTSSVCGAPNKTGGYCKRLVKGGGRCWQHR